MMWIGPSGMCLMRSKRSFAATAMLPGFFTSAGAVPEIAELDLNPLKVLPVGQGCSDKFLQYDSKSQVINPKSGCARMADFIVVPSFSASATTRSFSPVVAAELDAAVRSAPRALAATPVWADGPSGGFETAEEPIAESATDASLRDRLAMARESAAAVRAARCGRHCATSGAYTPRQ